MKKKDTYDTTAIVSMEAMQRFSNYKLIAKHDKSKSRHPKKGYAPKNMTIHKRGAGSHSPFPPSRGVRRLVLKEGYEYARVVPPSHSFHMRVPASEHPRHNLAVIGPQDDRTLVSDTTEFPFRVIGEILDDSGWGGCTATMISRNAAITLASCVHTGPGGDWNFDIDAFSPGRYGMSNGTVVNPFGTFEIDDILVFSHFLDFGTASRDYAVLLLHAVTRSADGCPDLYPGDVVGYVGFGLTFVSDSLLEASSMTGYQFDKVQLQQWTAGPFCSPSWKQDGLGFASHHCDSNDAGAAVLKFGGGQFDSEILGLNGYVYTSGGVSTANGGPIIEEQSVFDDIFDMSERGVSYPLCPDLVTAEPVEAEPSPAPQTDQQSKADECPCKQFLLFRFVCRLVHFRKCL